MAYSSAFRGFCRSLSILQTCRELCHVWFIFPACRELYHVWFILPTCRELDHVWFILPTCRELYHAWFILSTCQLNRACFILPTCCELHHVCFSLLTHRELYNSRCASDKVSSSGKGCERSCYGGSGFLPRILRDGRCVLKTWAGKEEVADLIMGNVRSKSLPRRGGYFQ